MSLSVGGYHPGYGHPAVPMGLSSAQDYYGAASAAQYQGTPGAGYSDYGVTDREYFNNWLLNGQLSGQQEVNMSPEHYGTPHYGTPSPPTVGGMQGQLPNMTGYEGGIQTIPHWQDYPMTTAELALAHNIPVSEIGQYETYTNAFGDRCLRRRTSANRKERRRTLSINNAFSNLRCSIPNVPSDTKLSKIKTLKLAISYISYLNNVLENGDSDLTETGFKADISRKRERRSMPTLPTKAMKTEVSKPADSCDSDDSTQSSSASCSSEAAKQKARTGWPQEVWASELRGSPHQVVKSETDSQFPVPDTASVSVSVSPQLDASIDATS